MTLLIEEPKEQIDTKPLHKGELYKSEAWQYFSTDPLILKSLGF